MTFVNDKDSSALY